MAEPWPSDMAEAIALSKSTAAWAMGLKCAIIAAWHRRSGVQLKALQGGKEQELRDWYLHLLNQHVPFRRDCEQCLIGAGAVNDKSMLVPTLWP